MEQWKVHVNAVLGNFRVALAPAGMSSEKARAWYVVPFIVQFGLYVSPVRFSSNVVPEEWRLLYSLNR